MGAGYHQFCPVAKAMELLDERWTMLVLRELMAGSDRFNALRRGLPRMSPALLSKRLHTLTVAGLVRNDDGRYVLTDAGLELTPIVQALARWGIRWIGELGDADLDPKLLLWDMHRQVDHDAVPAGRSVVHFEFTDVPGAVRSWWMVIAARQADVCDADPGFDVSVTVRGSLRRLTEVWRGDVSWQHAQRDGQLQVRGPEHVRRALPGWFARPGWAGTQRARPAAVRGGVTTAAG